MILPSVDNVVNMIPDELIGNLGDTHIYENQLKGIEEQLNRDIYELPKLDITKCISDCDFKTVTWDTFKLIDYKSGDKISFPLSN